MVGTEKRADADEEMQSQLPNRPPASPGPVSSTKVPFFFFFCTFWFDLLTADATDFFQKKKTNGSEWFFSSISADLIYSFIFISI